MKRILLVEDEAQIQKLVKMNLEIEGYEVIAQDDGHNVLHTLESEHIDLIILDLMLPDIDGIQILEQVRLRYSEIAVLIVSARDASADRILGLKSGADDYLTKPFNLEELILRVERLIQRTQPSDPIQVDSYNFGVNNVISFNNLVIDNYLPFSEYSLGHPGYEAHTFMANWFKEFIEEHDLIS